MENNVPLRLKAVQLAQLKKIWKRFPLLFFNSIIPLPIPITETKIHELKVFSFRIPLMWNTFPQTHRWAFHCSWWHRNEFPELQPDSGVESSGYVSRYRAVTPLHRPPQRCPPVKRLNSAISDRVRHTCAWTFIRWCYLSIGSLLLDSLWVHRVWNVESCDSFREQNFSQMFLLLFVFSALMTRSCWSCLLFRDKTHCILQAMSPEISADVLWKGWLDSKSSFLMTSFPLSSEHCFDYNDETHLWICGRQNPYPTWNIRLLVLTPAVLRVEPMQDWCAGADPGVWTGGGAKILSPKHVGPVICFTCQFFSLFLRREL